MLVRLRRLGWLTLLTSSCVGLLALGRAAKLAGLRLYDPHAESGERSECMVLNSSAVTALAAVNPVDAAASTSMPPRVIIPRAVYGGWLLEGLGGPSPS